MKNVLVVDDDRVTRHLLRTVLEQGGYRITTAADGEEALEEAARDRISSSSTSGFPACRAWRCWSACAGRDCGRGWW
jgi:CheY-like chemotaxis protein